MHARGLNNSLGNECSDDGRLNDSQGSDSYIHAGRLEKSGSHIFVTDEED